MTHHDESYNEPGPFDQMIQVLDECGFDGMARAIGILVNEAMKIERNEALGAQPYERTNHRRGYANGFKPKTLSTRIGQVELKIPPTRGVEFYPKSLERGVRSERALKLAVAKMYVQGVSTRKITKITSELCGLGVSNSQVSRAAKLFDEELKSWRERPLGKLTYLTLDARYEKVRHGGTVVDCAVLIAVGVLPSGKRTVLGVSSKLSEAERLLKITVERYRSTAPQLAQWMEQNIPEGLTVLTRPEAHRKRLRTSNMIERLNKEILRRTRVATLFPNEASLLRLVSAVLAEVDEEWQTGKNYPNIEAD